MHRQYWHITNLIFKRMDKEFLESNFELVRKLAIDANVLAHVLPMCSEFIPRSVLNSLVDRANKLDATADKLYQNFMDARYPRSKQ